MIKQSDISISLVIIAFFVIFFIQCKPIKRSFSLPPSLNDIYDDQKCYQNGKLTKSQRLQIFPFNEAESIIVISFNSKQGKTPIINDTIIPTKIIEHIQLSEIQIDSLTNILYNYNYSKKTNLITETENGCYYPRHSIVFLNNSKKVLSYIEICLECKKTIATLAPERLGNFCDGKYELLYNYFKAIGIEHFKD
jgi:hypothetical protein